MNLGYVFIPFFVGGAIVAAATPLLVKLSRRHGLYDQTSERKIHRAAISRLGGASMFLGLGLAGLGAMFWGEHSFSGRLAFGLGFGFTPIFAVSLLDDLKSIPWWVRFAVQVAGATVFALIVNPVERVNFPLVGTVELGFWAIPVVVVWLLVTTNALNFIDGLDGLATGIAAIAGTVLLISALRVSAVAPAALASGLVGICLGFLPYNFPPARIFMGDAGATLLGFVLGVMSLVGAGKNVALVSLLVPILALGIPLLDTLGAVLRRSYRGISIFEADREHVHHRLLSFGLGYRRTVVLLYLVSALLGGLALFLATGPRISAVFIAMLGLACLLLLLGKGDKSDRNVNG